MKFKLNIDKDSIREFFIYHCEKVLFGALILCFLLFVWRAAVRDTYPSSPQELEDASQHAETHMLKTPVDPGRVAEDYPELVDESRDPLAAKPYVHLTAWNKELFNKRVVRGQPKLFPVRNLRATAGYGAMQIKDTREERSERTRKTRETDPAKGRGPMDRDEGLGRGERPGRDERLGRGEAPGRGEFPGRGEAPGRRPPKTGKRTAPGIDGDGDIGELGLGVGMAPELGGRKRKRRSAGFTKGRRWVLLTGVVPVEEQEKAYYEEFKDSLGFDPAADVPDYHYYFVERADVTELPASGKFKWEQLRLDHALKVVRTWQQKPQPVVDKRFIHRKLTFPLPPLADRDWGEEAVSVPEIPLASTERGRWGGRGVGGFEMGMDEMPGRVGEAGFADEQPKEADEEEEEADLEEDPFADDRDARRKRLAQQRKTKKEEPAYYLFRFFDFTVEPGRRYRYRVRLLLRNPNYEVNARFLRDEKFGVGKGIETEPTPWTDVVTVPRDDRLLALSVKPSFRAAGEPSAKFMLVKFLDKTGEKVCEEVDKFIRGQFVSHCPDEKRTRRDEEPEEIVKYETGSVLLDVRGGYRLDMQGRELPPNSRDPSLNALGEVLILDPDGQLIVQNELDDLPDVEEYRELLGTDEEDTGVMGRQDFDRPGKDMVGPGMGGLFDMDAGVPKKGGRKTRPKTPRRKKRR